MWFPGAIAEAIGKAKRDKRILLVFIRSGLSRTKARGLIEASEEGSDQLEAVFREEDVKNLVTQHNIVALHMTGGSEAARQFKAIYPVPKLPMTYFIDPNGTPLEIITGPPEAPLQTLIAKINNAIKNLDKRLASVGTASLSDSTSPVPERSSQPSSAPLDERVNRARELIAEKRAAKEAAASEKEKEEEIQRREASRSWQEAQLRRQEEEAQKEAAERKRRKAEDRARLAQLREQIALDRKEKGMAYSLQQEEKSAARAEKKSQLDDAEKKRLEEEEERRNSQCRVQFRFANQTTEVAIYAAEEELSLAFAFVMEQLREKGLPTDDLRLLRAFPRLELTAADAASTFKDLGLVPSAVLIVSTV